jgi:hypothetical protein
MEYNTEVSYKITLDEPINFVQEAYYGATPVYPTFYQVTQIKITFEDERYWISVFGKKHHKGKVTTYAETNIVFVATDARVTEAKEEVVAYLMDVDPIFSTLRNALPYDMQARVK